MVPVSRRPPPSNFDPVPPLFLGENIERVRGKETVFWVQSCKSRCNLQNPVLLLFLLFCCLLFMVNWKNILGMWKFIALLAGVTCAVL